MSWNCLKVTKTSVFLAIFLVLLTTFVFESKFSVSDQIYDSFARSTSSVSSAGANATSASGMATTSSDSSKAKEDSTTENPSSMKDFIPYTFDDPAQYSGPILAGWPPEKSRNVSLYLRPGEDTVLSDMSCMDFGGVRLFAVVQSAPFMFERRQLVRDTYMQFTKTLTDVKLVFLFGTSADQNATRLQEEQQTFCDVIQADYVDSYENVTLDTLTVLKLALGINWKPEPPKFVVIADDDSYVNLEGIHKELFLNEKGVLKEDDKKMWGYQLLPYIHYPTDIYGNRTIIPKNPFPYSPSYMYNQKLYPPFLTGGGYVIPFKTAACLYEKSLALPLYHINDVFISGLVRQECGLTLETDKRFLPHRMDFIILTWDVFVYHQGTERGRRVMDHVIRVQKGRTEECRGGAYCIRDKVLLWCKYSDKDCMNVDLAYNQV